MSKLNLHKFDPNVMSERRLRGSAPTCALLGKRGTGKSTLLLDLMYYQRTIPMGLIMSGTEESTGAFSDYFPDLFIHSEFNPEALENLFEQQKKIIKLEKDNIQNGHSFLIIDDLMYDRKMIRHKNLRKLFMNGRHWRITFFLTMQYMMDLPPDLRTNIDYIFILRENIVANQIKIWKNFFGVFETFKSFRETLIECTEDFECLVLDNTSKSNNVEDCVYWYKANSTRKYKIGSRKLWEFAEQNYNENYDDKGIKDKHVQITKSGIKNKLHKEKKSKERK